MSDESKRYNGWRNYETWNVALWIDNDQGTYNLRNYWTREAYDNARAERSFTRMERAALTLADCIKDYVESNNPVQEASMYADLLGAAISEVDWLEIAENWLADVEKEPEEVDAE